MAGYGIDIILYDGGEHMKQMSKLLVAYDGSDNSTKALDTAVGLAKQLEAELVVVGVLAPSSVYAGFDPNNVVIIGQLWEIAEKEAQRALEKAQKFCAEQGMQPKINLYHGNPADEIIKHAAQEKADLIICGSRGLGGFEGLLMGSVAHKLVSYAKVPVLVVK